MAGKLPDGKTPADGVKADVGAEGERAGQGEAASQSRPRARPGVLFKNTRRSDTSKGKGKGKGGILGLPKRIP
jgi:hypothetical protein